MYTSYANSQIHKAEGNDAAQPSPPHEPLWSHRPRRTEKKVGSRSKASPASVGSGVPEATSGQDGIFQASG